MWVEMVIRVKLLARWLYHLIKALVICVAASAFWGCASIAQKAKPLSTGVISERILTDGGQTAYVVTVELDKVKLTLVRAQSKSGLETPTSLAQRSDAIAAINGGFFTKEGRPVGALKIDGAWHSLPSKLRGVFGFNQNGETFFDRLGQHEGHMYNSPQKLAMDEWWERAENIIGGAPLLISGSLALDPSPERTLESFLTATYARTAICRCQNNRLKFVVINGGDHTANKFWPKSGMSIGQLTQFLLSMGCTDALNLDGGYSSSFIELGRRLNSFSISFLPERKVATVLAVTRK
jgi:exopolysaccharide biosynthesis protein